MNVYVIDYEFKSTRYQKKAVVLAKDEAVAVADLEHEYRTVGESIIRVHSVEIQNTNVIVVV